jgi:hypothetical protein
MGSKRFIEGTTTNDIESIQVFLCMKDGRMLVGKTDNRIIKNIMAEFVEFAEVKPELIYEENLSKIIKMQE